MPRISLLLLAFGLAACRAAGPVPAAAVPNEAGRIAAIVDPIVETGLAEAGIPGAAFVFVRDGRIVHARGYGVADVAARVPAAPERTVWPVASITKVVTAVAALQLVEDGRIGLDRDVNRYLRRLQVPDQGFGPLSLRHLLSHTGGLDELPGRRFDGVAAPDHAAFLAGKLVRYRAPGLRTAYSTYGIALAGLMVEDVSGARYEARLRDRIFAPAGMASARFMVERGDEKGVATPYAIEDGRAEPVAHEFYVTRPSSSMVATAADMGRLIAALLGGRLLKPATVQEMLRQQASVHPALPGWGLGVQLDLVIGVRVAEHGGDIAGFSSLLVLLPETNAGFFVVHHGEGGDLRFRVRDALIDSLHPARITRVPAADPADALRLREYAGRYLSSLACRSCPASDDNVFIVSVEPEGALRLWGRKWLPYGRDLFIREDGRRLLGFSRDRGGRIDSLSGGSWRVADRLP